MAVVMTKATYRGRVYLEFMIPKSVKAFDLEAEKMKAQS